jgi:hypothetical protein
MPVPLILHSGTGISNKHSAKFDLHLNVFIYSKVFSFNFHCPFNYSETWRADRSLTRTRFSPHCSQRWTAWGARYRRNSAQVGYSHDIVSLKVSGSCETVPFQDIYSRKALLYRKFNLVRLSLHR